MTDAKQVIYNALNQSQRALADLMQNQPALDAIQKAGLLLVDCFSSGGRVVSCGNGGSLCDAMHFAEELSGRFRRDRAPLAAMAISDPAHMSCSANDFGYEEVFSRFVTAHCRKGDILLAISTSGTSANVLNAAVAAKKCGAMVISLTGKKENALADISDCHIGTPGGTGFSDRVQELHIKCIHILVELVEKGFLGIEY